MILTYRHSLKIKGEIPQNDFLIISKQYSDEKSDLQNQVNMLAEKLAIGKRNSSKIFEILTFIKETDFSEITQEICDKLMRKKELSIMADKL